MSLEQHSIDQAYNARLSNLEAAPPAHAWAAIVAQLPDSPDRNRGAFWWWSGAFLALLALSFLGYYGLNSADSNNNPGPNPQSNQAALAPIAATATDNYIEDSNSAAAAAEKDKPEIEGLAKKEVAKVISPAPSKAIASANSPTLSQLVQATALPSNYEVKNPHQKFSDQTELSSSNRATSNYGTTTALNVVKESPKPPSKLNAVGLSITSISADKLPVLSLTEFQTALPMLPAGPKVICEDFRNSRGWNFAVRAFAGPGTVIQDFKSSTQNTAYQALRDSVEMDQLSVHAGLRFEAVNSVGLFLRAGADYQQYRTNVVSLGPPSSRTVIDSVFMEATQTWRVETRNEVFQERRDVYNRQHSVALTAGIGYRPTFGNVSPYIMVEAGYEFLFKKRGTFVLPDGNFIDLADDDDDLYINDRPGFQYGGVIGVDFAITSQIEVGLSGHYKKLGGLRGSADLLDFDQSTVFGALNLRYTLGGF